VGEETGFHEPVPEWVAALNPARIPESSTQERKQQAKRSTEVGSGGDSGEGGTEQAGHTVHRSRPVEWLLGLTRNAWQFLNETPDSSVGWARTARVKARVLAAQNRPDALYSTGPPHSTHLVAMDLKRRFQIPWLADLRDPVGRHPWGPRPRNPWGQRVRPWFERKIVTTADVVVLNSPGMHADFVRAHPDLPPERFAYIPNGCDEEHLELVAGLLRNLPPRHDDSAEPITLLHPGTLYGSRDPRPLMEAVGLLRQKGWNLRMHQIGNVAPTYNVPKLIADLGLQQGVFCEPAVPRLEIYQRMAQADVLLLIQPGTSLQIPAKIYEMLPFGKPILAIAPPGSTASVVERYGLGLVVDNTTPSEIAATLEKLLQSRHEVATGPGWAQARADFDGTHLTGELARLLDRICDR
jgi:glycosyltransferase involved in cell wall biosynthesis